MSLYVSGDVGGKTLVEFYGYRLAKTNTGKACIRFLKFEDLTIDALRELILADGGMILVL
jgi:hypothetical protein